MPKSWPCDRTNRNKGKKTTKEVPSIHSLDSFDGESNVLIYCHTCKRFGLQSKIKDGINVKIAAMRKNK